MSNELRIQGYVADRTMTARISNAAGKFWHVASEAFETYGASGDAASSYDIAMTDVGGGAYRGDFPTAITTRGTYFVDYWDSAISTQAVLQQVIDWTGTAAASAIEEGDNTPLCNFALGIVGGAIQADYPWIEDYDAEAGTGSANPTLRWCQSLLPQARRRIQSSFLWPRLMTYADPGDPLEEDDANGVPGYLYLFDRPEGCLIFVGVFFDIVNLQTGKLTPVPFLEVGGQIACNYSDDIKFGCTVENTDPSQWGQPLFEATGYALALLLSRALGITQEGQSYIKVLADEVYQKATNDAAREQYSHKPYDPLNRYHAPIPAIRNGLFYPGG
jgi:hypothetical protein